MGVADEVKPVLDDLVLYLERGYVEAATDILI